MTFKTPQRKMHRVVDSVLMRLDRLPEPCSGTLYGIMSGEMVVVNSFCLDSINENNSNSVSIHFPYGIEPCGKFYVSNSKFSNHSVSEMLKDLSSLKTALVIHKVCGGEVKMHSFSNGEIKEISVEVLSESNFFENYMYLHVSGTVDVNMPWNSFADESEMNEMNFLEGCVFCSSVPEIDENNDNTVISSDKFFSPTDEFISFLNREVNSKDPRLQKGTLEMLILQPVENPREYISSAVDILVNDQIHFIKKINVDTVLLIDKTLFIKDSYRILKESVIKYFNFLRSSLKCIEKEKINTARTFHFYPESLCHFFSYVGDIHTTDIESRNLREEFHSKLGLPRDKPCFRRGNRILFDNEKIKKNILFNVHEGLKPSGVTDGICYITSGLYSYHHYLQDNINDDGWGCAYRSLQTLFSWYRWQGFTDMEIPSITEIQSCLIKIGDKPRSFLNSREWIGSTEVGYCLNTLLNITTRIMNFSSGSELANSASILLQHFEIHGTPIMIGGGQLAHTILGVHYNEEKKDLKFLVLDPHYTGKEDIKFIQSKGWVGWKGIDFWKKHSFYNICLPLRPKCT